MKFVAMAFLLTSVFLGGGWYRERRQRADEAAAWVMDREKASNESFEQKTKISDLRAKLRDPSHYFFCEEDEVWPWPIDFNDNVIPENRWGLPSNSYGSTIEGAMIMDFTTGEAPPQATARAQLYQARIDRMKIYKEKKLTRKPRGTDGTP